jgi:hypothetical protein
MTVIERCRKSARGKSLKKNANFAGQRVGIQTVRRRLWELFFLDWDIGLLASSRDPNSVGRNLFWFGLRVVGFLQIFYSQAAIQRKIVGSPAFLEHGLAEKIAVCDHTIRYPNK